MEMRYLMKNGFLNLRLSLGLLLIVVLLIFVYRIANPPAQESTKLASDEIVRAEYIKVHSHPKSEVNNLYYVWVRSFKDSDGDGIGDLNGITDRFPYLQEIGVESIILSPIFDSPSYHGYEISDFNKISSDFGTIEDLRELVSAAHKVGIKVYLDLVLNHTSDQHNWFVQSLANDPEYSDFYVWSNQMPSEYGLAWGDEPSPNSVWHTKIERPGEYFYGAFGFASPDLNYKNPKVIDAIVQVMMKWMNEGIAGFRIDAARYLIETGPIEGQRDTQENFKVLESLFSQVREQFPKAEFIGEVYAGTEITPKYLQDKNGLNAVFNFEFTYSVFNALQSANDESGVKLEEVLDSLSQFYERARDVSQVSSNQFVFLSNHDIGRSELFSSSLNTQKIAMSLLLMSPFIPTIYYGDELGLFPYSGENNKDVFKRDLMQWTDSLMWAGFSSSQAVWVDNPLYFPWDPNVNPWAKDKLLQQLYLNVQNELENEDSLLKHVSRLLKKRKNLNIFSQPNRIYSIIDVAPLFGMEIQTESEQVVVLINVDQSRAHFVSQTVFKDFAIQPLDSELSADSGIYNKLEPGEALVLAVPSEARKIL